MPKMKQQSANCRLFALFSSLMFSVYGHAQEQTAVSLYWAGVRQTQATNYAAAVSNYTQAIQMFTQEHDESNRTNARAYSNRGFVRDKLGDHSGALIDVDEAIRLDPTSSPIYYNRGSMRFSQNDCAGALADFNQAVNLDPKFIPALATRGIVERTMNDLAAAAVNFRKLAELQSTNAIAYAGLAYVQSDQRQWTEALTNFQKALQLDLSFTDFPFQIWLIRMRLGDTNTATRELLDLAKSHADIQRDRKFGEVLLSFLTGDVPETEFLRQAKTLEGDTDSQTRHLSAANYYVGMKHLLAGDRTVAAEYFQKCLAIGDKHQINYPSARAELNALKP
jgi:tetratricopeptide (TPR) repeat protein